MVKNKSVDILFCGLIREEELFKKSILDLVSLRKKGFVDNIFLSTWIGETQKYPEIKSLLKKYKIKIIESEEPRYNPYAGFIWHQMKALEEGLKKINKNNFVLKTRTDLYINPDFLKILFSSKEKLLKIKKPLPKRNIFKYKVWVPWYELTRPFYLDDVCFFGHHHDLKLLYNYNTFYDKKYDIGGDLNHVRRYIDPFLKDYPLLYNALGKFSKEKMFKVVVGKISDRLYIFLQKFQKLRKLSEKNRFQILRKRLKDEEFLLLLATYYSILHSHFYIDSCTVPNQIIFREQSKPFVKSDKNIAEKNFSKDKVRVPYSGRIVFYEQGFLNNLCEKKLVPTPLARNLFQALNKFNNQ